MDRTAKFYASPSYAHGAGFPIFSGSRRRRGGGILGALANFAMPMLKGLASKGMNQAVGLATDVAGDMMRGRNIKQSILRHGIRRAKNVGTEMLGNAFGRATSRPSRKRKAPLRKTKQRATKRRRTNF